MSTGLFFYCNVLENLCEDLLNICDNIVLVVGLMSGSDYSKPGKNNP